MKQVEKHCQSRRQLEHWFKTNYELVDSCCVRFLSSFCFEDNILLLSRSMDSIRHDHNTDAIDSQSDEPEFDFTEYYSREKTLALRDIYIP
jgi:hypothetical protein